MANNHIRDYGKAGIIETCAILDGNNIKHFGLWGECGNESTIIKVRDLNVGLIAFAENEFSTDKSDGCAAVGLDHSWQFKQIAALKPGTDYIIAQYHGGVEFYPYPPPNQQKYCRWLIDAGADLVICHHSHTVSGHETYSGKKIYYGLGNFFFPEAGNETDWFFGLGVGLRFDDPVTATIMPVFYDMPNNLLDLGDETRSSSLLAGINQVIDDEQLINKAWDDYCVANQNRTLMSVLRPGRFARLLIKLGLMKLSLEKQAGLSLLNLLRCESHYDRIKHTLELLNEKRENRRHS
jgi:poly-gamma-glutamate synthesis protein (capsule biosynthesis protein)